MEETEGREEKGRKQWGKGGHRRDLEGICAIYAPIGNPGCAPDEDEDRCSRYRPTTGQTDHEPSQ